MLQAAGRAPMCRSVGGGPILGHGSQCSHELAAVWCLQAPASSSGPTVMAYRFIHAWLRQNVSHQFAVVVQRIHPSRCPAGSSGGSEEGCGNPRGRGLRGRAVGHSPEAAGQGPGRNQPGGRSADCHGAPRGSASGPAPHSSQLGRAAYGRRRGRGSWRWSRCA